MSKKRASSYEADTPPMVGSVTCTLGLADVRFDEAVKAGGAWRVPIRVSPFSEWKNEEKALRAVLRRANPNVGLVYDEERQRLVVVGSKGSTVGKRHCVDAAGRFLREISVTYQMSIPAHMRELLSRQLRDPASEISLSRAARIKRMLEARPARLGQQHIA